MVGQYLIYVAVLAVLLAGPSAAQAPAVEPGACDEPQLDCASCLALAPNCSWFVCERDPLESHCANTTTGGAEGCRPADATECAADDKTTTAEPPTSTTIFSTTDVPTTTDVPSTTETPTTETPTTEAPTSPPTTSEPPTEPPTEPTTTETPTTEVPSTANPGPAPGPAPTPAPRTGGFSFGSFVGGIVFMAVMGALVFIGLKIYRRRQAMAGRYNNLWGNDAERMHLTI